MILDPIRLMTLLGREKSGDPEAVQELVQMGASSDSKLRRLQLMSLAQWSMLAVQTKNNAQCWHCAAVCECGKEISLTSMTQQSLVTCPACHKATPCAAWHGPSVSFS